MKIRYFADTDTLYIEFREQPVAETRDLDENTMLDVDAEGNICAITDHRGADPRAQGRRRRAHLGADVHGTRRVHAQLMKHEPPVDLTGSVLYHCGPVVAKNGETWSVTAAGPTTSIREEPYQADIIKRYGVRVVIGKGGMGAKTLAGLKESGAVYLNAVGGAAQFYPRGIEPRVADSRRRTGAYARIRDRIGWEQPAREPRIRTSVYRLPV